MKRCHCGEEFEDPLFITCPKCRLPDKPKRPRKAKRFCTYNNKTAHWLESGSFFDDIVKAYEE